MAADGSSNDALSSVIALTKRRDAAAHAQGLGASDRDEWADKIRALAAQDQAETAAERQAKDRLRKKIEAGVSTLFEVLRLLEPGGPFSGHAIGPDRVTYMTGPFYPNRPLDSEDFKRWLPPEVLAAFVGYAMHFRAQDYKAMVLSAAQDGLRASGDAERGASIMVAYNAAELAGGPRPSRLGE